MRSSASWRSSSQRPSTSRIRTRWPRSRRPRAVSAALTHAPAGSCWLPSRRITGRSGERREAHLMHRMTWVCTYCFCSVHNPFFFSNCRERWIIRNILFSPCAPCRKRAPYIAYLTRCRQGLQTSQAHLERLLQRVLRDKEVANRYFTTVCVRLLLEHMESKMLDFIKGTSALLFCLLLIPAWLVCSSAGLCCCSPKYSPPSLPSLSVIFWDNPSFIMLWHLLLHN